MTIVGRTSLSVSIVIVINSKLSFVASRNLHSPFGSSKQTVEDRSTQQAAHILLSYSRENPSPCVAPRHTLCHSSFISDPDFSSLGPSGGIPRLAADSDGVAQILFQSLLGHITLAAESTGGSAGSRSSIFPFTLHLQSCDTLSKDSQSRSADS